MITALLGFTQRLPNFGFSFRVPQNWDELSQRQVLALMPLITKPQPRLMLEARIVLILLDVRWWQVFKQLYLLFLPAELKLHLHDLTSWVFEGAPRFEENPFPVLKVKGKTFYGPAQYLRHVRTMEFFLALRALNKHRDTGNMKHLRDMAAQIYRPAKQNINPHHPEWDGDYRQAYSQHVAEEISKQLEALPDAYFWALKIYFETALPVITAPYPAMFPQKSEAELKKEGKKKDNTTEIIKSILFNLPGDTFGRLTDRANERLVNVLAYLEEERLKHERQMEAINNTGGNKKIKH